MALKDFRYLVVDDHFLLRHMVEATLKEVGITQVEYAPDGVLGIEKIQTALTSKTPYEIIFLDWSMPKMTGYDVLVACRKDKTLDDTAIIMLTSESEDTNIVLALDAGATAYITKPFKPEVLVKKLEDVEQWLLKKKIGHKT